MKFRIYWGPTGQSFGVVEADTPKAARRKAPKQYLKYLGEIGVELVEGTQYEVHTGRPSWPQQRAGHISSGATIFYMRADAEKYLAKCKELRPDEPAFIIERQVKS